jgi:hypothetical protein
MSSSIKTLCHFRDGIDEWMNSTHKKESRTVSKAGCFVMAVNLTGERMFSSNFWWQLAGIVEFHGISNDLDKLIIH